MRFDKYRLLNLQYSDEEKKLLDDFWDWCDEYISSNFGFISPNIIEDKLFKIFTEQTRYLHRIRKVEDKHMMYYVIKCIFGLINYRGSLMLLDISYALWIDTARLLSNSQIVVDSTKEVNMLKFRIALVFLTKNRKCHTEDILFNMSNVVCAQVKEHDCYELEELTIDDVCNMLSFTGEYKEKLVALIDGMSF